MSQIYSSVDSTIMQISVVIIVFAMFMNILFIRKEPECAPKDHSTPDKIEITSLVIAFIMMAVVLPITLVFGGNMRSLVKSTKHFAMYLTVVISLLISLILYSIAAYSKNIDNDTEFRLKGSSAVFTLLALFLLSISSNVGPSALKKFFCRC